MGPPGPGSSQYGSRYSMSRTCGPLDIISLVIPRIGDNNKDPKMYYKQIILPENNKYLGSSYDTSWKSQKNVNFNNKSC
jgi:hypothetical protein